MIRLQSIILAIFICACGTTRAQDTAILYNKITFKIAPLSFIDIISFPSFQAGFEFRFTPVYSVDFSYGQIFGKEFLVGYHGTGFKTKAEFRRYFRVYKRRKLNKYFAAEGFFNKADYIASGEFENILDSANYSYSEEYKIKKTTYGINAKFGFEITVLKHFVLDVYGGVGFRHKNVEHLNRSRPQDSFYLKDLLAYQIRDHEGNYTIPNITFGFKIGYILK